MVIFLKIIYNKTKKIIELLRIDFFNTIRINAKLPLKQAIKLPIVVYHSKIDSLKGEIIIDSNKISFNMISIGKRTSNLNIRKNG